MKLLFVLKNYEELKPYVEETVKIEEKIHDVGKREQLLSYIAQYMAKEDKERAEKYIEKRKRLLESI